MELYRPKNYPQPVRARIAALGPAAADVANRWMLGWPKVVATLLETGEYLPALERQAELERNARAEPGLDHLSSWEKAQVMGLSDAPPMPESRDADETDETNEVPEPEDDPVLQRLRASRMAMAELNAVISNRDRET